MSNTQKPVVTVCVFYDGEQTARQAFLSLIYEKLKSQKNTVDKTARGPYNKDNPNRGVHGGMENQNGNQ